MALVTQLVDVPFRGGLAEGIAPELVPAGGWLTLENVEIDQAGEVHKRPGFGEDTQSSFFGPVQQVRSHEAREELLLVSHLEAEVDGRYASTGDRLRARAEGRPWVDRGALSPFDVRRRPLVRSQEDLDQSCTQVAVSGRARAVVWMQPNLEGGSYKDVWFRVDDATTGAVLVEAQRISDPPALAGLDTPDTCTVIVSGSWFVVVWDTLGSGASLGFGWLRAWRCSTDLNNLDSSPTSLTLVTASGRALIWDAAPLDGAGSAGRWVWAHVNQSTGDVDVYTNAASTLVDTYRYTVTADTVTALQVHGRAAVGSAPARVAVGFIDLGLPEFYVLEATGWTLVGSNFGLESTGAWDRVTLHLDRAGLWLAVAYSGEPVSGEEETKWRTLEIATGAPMAPVSLGGAARVVGQEIWSRLFEPHADDARIYLITTSYTGTGKRDSGYQIIDTYTYSLSNRVPPGWHGQLARYGGKGQPPLSPAWVASSTADTLHLPVLVTSDETGVGQVDEAILTLGAADLPGLHQTAEAQGLSVITGGLTCYYDGEEVLSAGFAEPPVISGALVTYQATGIEGDAVNTNVYLYTAIYSYRDAAGNVHTSEPAPLKTVSISTGGGFTTARVDLTIRCTSLVHGPEPAGRLSRTVAVVIFRTVKNSPTPLYQRVTAVSLENATKEYDVTYTDELNDAGLLALGYGLLYTHGGILPSQPAPPSTAAVVHGSRLWLADAEDRRRLWFSRSLVPGEAPAFNEEMTVRFDDSPDEITGIASLDSSLAVFTSSRIYLVDGDGPADTGEGPEFSSRLLTTTSGCIDGRSIVRFEGGVIYRDPSGLQLLARGGLPAPVGDAVRTTLRSYPRTRGSAHDAAGRRCFWAVDTGDTAVELDARLVVFDYDAGSWGTWSWALANPFAGCTARGSYPVVVHDGARILLPTSQGYDEGDTWIAMRVRTPWVRVGALGGYQRTRRMVVQGELLSDCTLHGRLYLDHDPSTVRDSWSWDLGPSTTVALLPHLALRAVLGAQRGRAVSVELYDAAPTELDRAVSTGVRLYGLTLEIGVSPGLAWMAAGNKR